MSQSETDKYYLINRQTGVYEAEAIDVNGTLHVHFYKSSLSFTYKFGEWPSMRKYEYKRKQE